MGNAIFPSTPEYSWRVSKTPQFSTAVKSAASGRELRASLTAYPLYQLTLSFDVLRQQWSEDEFEKLVGFFLQRRGRFDSFLFSDPSDHAVTDESFGTANGSLTAFQLSRSFGGFAEPIENIHAVSGIKLNGSAVGISYTVGSTGVVTFSSAPSAGLLTWSGTFYYRCRFVNDENEFSQFARYLWESKQVQLLGAPGNKI